MAKIRSKILRRKILLMRLYVLTLTLILVLALTALLIPMCYQEFRRKQVL